MTFARRRWIPRSHPWNRVARAPLDQLSHRAIGSRRAIAKRTHEVVRAETIHAARLLL